MTTNRSGFLPPSGGSGATPEESSSQPASALLGPDPWRVRRFDPVLGGPGFGDLVAAMRDLQDVFVGASPPLDVVDRMADQIRALAAEFRAWQPDEDSAPAGMRNDLPGRGSAMLVPVIIEEQDAHHMRGRVTFTRFHLGGNGAAHGGTLPLMFDDVVGRLVNGPDAPVARTAFLHVNYRRITKVGVELRVEATVDTIEGRKRWASGRLWEGDLLVADAEGLFVELRPGQP